MIAILFGIIFGIVNYFSSALSSAFKKHYNAISSLSAGISITYIFLHLFPLFSEGASKINDLLFTFVLLGFVVFHLVEKYIYQHSPKDKLLKKLALEDSAISFIYHFVIGIIFLGFLNQGLTHGLLFFIPILLYTSISTLPVDITRVKSIRIIVALSVLLGIIFASYTTISQFSYLALLGFIIGALSFTVFRHSIPRGKEGKPLFFIIGVVIYSVLIFLL